MIPAHEVVALLEELVLSRIEVDVRVCAGALETISRS
jgi:hypothetical protein